jgi:hypothetical protein
MVTASRFAADLQGSGTSTANTGGNRRDANAQGSPVG